MAQELTFFSNYPATYPTHLYQGRRRVGTILQGQSNCRIRCMLCKLRGTRACSMMRGTTIRERGATATGSKRTCGGWERRAGERRVGSRTVSTASKVATVSQIAAPQGSRGLICVWVRRHSAGPPSSPRKRRQFRRSQPPRMARSNLNLGGASLL